MLRAALLVFCVSGVVARTSPHVDVVEEYVRTTGARVSDNILEDASLDVPGLVQKYGYPLEAHSVTTQDGYILEVHRIPHGRDRNNVPGPRPVVFLMHGLLSSSADWVVTGPGTAFGYFLAEEGFDVWMGNARGTYYSRQHVTLDPDAKDNIAFWQYSWDEIGNLDLPAMIDKALAVSGQTKLHYIGHSQGTTSFFVMASLRPDYNQKIRSMHAYAPVAYMANNRSPFLRLLSRFANDIEAVLAERGRGEFLPNSDLISWLGRTLCKDGAATQPLCSNIVFLIGGTNADQHNATLLPLKLGHTPAGAAARQFVHYGQGIVGKGFRRYDHADELLNIKAYGVNPPPRYELSRITAPVFLHYSDSDPLAHVNDVDRLFRELGTAIGKFRIPMATFSHIDFIWGINAKELLYIRTINLIRAMEINDVYSSDLV